MTPGILILEEGTDQEFLDCLEKLDIRHCYFCGQILLAGDRVETTAKLLTDTVVVYRCRDAYACGGRTSAIIETMHRRYCV